MIYTYPLYLVRNYIVEGASFEEGAGVKREIEYFPSFYYKTGKGMVEITVRLDGSKFHEDGSFENLTKILEDFYVLNVVGITQRKEYLTDVYKRQVMRLLNIRYRQTAARKRR